MCKTILLNNNSELCSSSYYYFFWSFVKGLHLVNNTKHKTHFGFLKLNVFFCNNSIYYF